MLIGPRHDAVNAQSSVNASVGGFRLIPRLLTSGSFALPDAVLTNPGYAAAHPVLATWPAQPNPTSSDYIAPPDVRRPFNVLVDGKIMHHDGRAGSVTMPHADVFRFEVRVNDFAANYDSTNQNRRSELISRPSDGVGVETVWQSFCCILGDRPGLTKTRSGPLGLITQWHSVDVGIVRSPVLGVDCSNNVMSIITRSSSSVDGNQNGIGVIHYSGAIPAKGEKTYYVMQCTFGQAGHLNAWINGTQVVNVDTPVGYYTDLTDGSGRTKLGYPHYGLYTRNQPETDIVYIANPEWGLGDLSARIATPLPVPDLTW